MNNLTQLAMMTEEQRQTYYRLAKEHQVKVRREVLLILKVVFGGTVAYVGLICLFGMCHLIS